MTIEPTNVSEGLETVKIVKIIRPKFTVERPEDPFLAGDREIWARHEEHPEFDVKLATVHYCYAYLDNATIGPAAERMAATLSPPLPSPGVERLREALEIFAESADDIERAYGSSVPDDQYQFPPLRMSDFRRARAALSVLPLDGGL